jgi:hypothetical protein
MSMPELGRLEVNVARGFADSEFYVMVPGGPAAYVSRDLVSVEAVPIEGAEVPGHVQVYVLERGEDDALIELPGQPVIGGLRARVDKSLLLSA